MRRILFSCSRAWHDQSGTAAIEFAMIAPVFFIFIMGTVEISNAIRVQAKLNVVVGQLAELVAGQSSVTAPSGTLADICTGAAMNITPYPASVLSANIVSISNDHPANRLASTDNTTVNTYLDWENISSCATQASSTLDLAGAFALANTPTSLLTKSGASAAGTNSPDLKYGYSVIVIKAQYTYTNVLMFFLGKTINFSAVAVIRPRANATVQCLKVDGSAPCPQTS